MIRTLFILLVLSSIGWAQSIAPATTNTVTFADHPQHATQHALGTEQNLLPSNGVTTAHGELPLSDFDTEPAPTVSLGQVAREYAQGTPVNRPIIRVIP
jgi:hypothetical protein